MQLWWILISGNSCLCIQLLSGGLAYMLYEYYFCKVIKEGIKMLSIHHCQLLIRHWNKFIRMWHKIGISIPVPRFSLLLYLLPGLRQFHWILVLLGKKGTQQMQLKEERRVYLPFCLQGVSTSWWGNLWWQEQEMVGHTVPTVEKQRVMNPVFSLLSSF